MAARRSKATKSDLEEKKKRFANIAGNLEEVPVEKFLKDNFLPYAWSYLLDRALVDVTGLKPVHRRILYTMYKAGLSPTSTRSKVATLGGRVLAYHPHGNASVEDALKNLAREHVMRVPMIDGKGDFGAPGSPGAAPRYIEARLNQAGWLNVEEISQNAVKMVPNYDGTTTEPVRIPVKWPVAIVNGSAGIAIGYASTMASHNPTEIMKACKLLVRNPDATHRALSKIVLGPDFNMGGTITSNEGVLEYLKTGRGSFKIRGNYTISQMPRGVTRIEFHEIPFGTYPEKIFQDMQKQMESKGRFKDISSFKDLSDLQHPIRIVIDTKAGVNYKRVLAELFSYTSLEASFSANVVTIIDNKPITASMKDLLLNFIDFRRECVRNKSTFGRDKKANRLHLVNGLLKTMLDIDAAIAIIRKSNSAEDASVALQKKFKIDDAQAEHVLSLQLRRLTKMDKVALDTEAKTLAEEIAALDLLIRDPAKMNEHLLQEFDETMKIIGDERRTVILSNTKEGLLEAEKAEAQEHKVADKNTPAVITRFANNSFWRAKDGFAYPAGSRKYENSPVVERIPVMTQDEVVLIGNDGIGRRIPVGYLNDGAITTAKNAGIELPKGVSVVGICKSVSGAGDIGVALMTKMGQVKVSKTNFPKSSEFPVTLLDEGDEVVNTRWLSGDTSDTWFVAATKMSNILIFPASTVRASGSKAGGVKGMKLKDTNDQVVSFDWVSDLNNKKIVSQATRTLKLTPASEIPTKNKGGMGVALHKFIRGENALTSVHVSDNPVIALEKRSSVVPPPAATKRATRGIDFPAKVLFGEA